jgi:RHS repeat-associated protein
MPRPSHPPSTLARSALVALLATGTLGSATAGVAASPPNARAALRAGPRAAVSVTAERASPPDASPDGGSLNATENAASLSATFWVYNTGPNATNYSFSCSNGGAVTGCTPPGAMTINPGQQVPVTVTYSTGAAGNGTLYFWAEDWWEGWTDQASYNVAVIGPRMPPTLDLSPHNGDTRIADLCAEACFDAVVSHSTPAYISLGISHSATLVYRSSQAAPRGLVQVDATDNSTDPATKVSIRLKRPDGSWVTFTNGTQEIFFARGAGKSRLAAQFDAANTPQTGSYSYTLVVRNWWADGSMRESSTPIRVMIVTEEFNRFGWGWNLAGLEWLFPQADGAVVISDGAGSAVRFYPACGGCTGSASSADFGTVTTVATVGADGVKWRRRYPTGTVAAFRSDGRMIWIEDRFGNRTTYNWDNLARLQWIGDPGGNSIWFGYDNNWKLANILDTGGLRVSYFTVDAAGDLTAIVDPLGVTTFRATYDASHRMKTRTDRRGATYGFAYDFAGKLAADTLPLISADGANVRPVTKWKSLEAAVLVDPASGKGTSLTNFAARIISDSVRATRTNARANVTRYALDGFGAPKRIEESLARTTVLTRNAHSQVTQSVSPSGHTVNYTWVGPELRNVHDQTTGLSESMTYEPTYHELTSKWDGITGVWQTWSGGALQHRDVGEAQGQNRTRYTYETVSGRVTGRVATVTDPANHVISYVYATAGAGRPLLSMTAAGRTWTYGYDTYGRLQSTTASTGTRTTAEYDDLGRPTRTIGALNDTTTIEYDNLYRTSVTDASGRIYRFTPNALGWVQQQTDPANKLVAFTYDVAGNLKKVVNRRTQSVTFTYDALDQLATRVADGVTTTYKTDPKGLFTLASNSESVDTSKYDVAGRVVAQISVRNKKRYERKSLYNAHGKRTHLIVAAPWADTITYEYDTKVRLQTLVDFAGGRTGISYNLDWQPTLIGLPTASPVTVDRGFPATHTPSRVLYTASTGDLAGALYAYGNDPQVERRVDFIDELQEYGRHYSYDALKRLTGYSDYVANRTENICGDPSIDSDPITGRDCWSHAGPPIVHDTSAYGYDKLGNRSDSGAVVLPGNRLARFKGDTLTYDADGNLIRRRRLPSGPTTDSLIWNSLGQLTAVRRNGTLVASFFYNGFGERVRKVAGTVTTRYVHDGDDLLAEVDANGNRIAEYTYYPGIDGPHSVRRWSGSVASVYYFGTDHPGNVVALFDQSGAVVTRYGYAPFGTLQDSAGTSVTNPLRFAARELDKETDLYFMRARYYDPKLGRFISEDPAGIGASPNLYTFASNDPMNRRDPSGLCDDIPVHILDDDGEHSTWWDLCGLGGGGETFDGILNHAAEMGVGAGAAAWGSGGRGLAEGVGSAILWTRSDKFKHCDARRVNYVDEGTFYGPRKVLTTHFKIELTQWRVTQKIQNGKVVNLVGFYEGYITVGYGLKGVTPMVYKIERSLGTGANVTCSTDRFWGVGVKQGGQ